MAEKVAKWYDDYNCDGIDLDLEEGAGARKEAGPNMIHFVRKLRQLQPKMIISQPTYGYPQVDMNLPWNWVRQCHINVFVIRRFKLRLM